jgi:hypothetical protein
VPQGCLIKGKEDKITVWLTCTAGYGGSTCTICKPGRFVALVATCPICGTACIYCVECNRVTCCCRHSLQHQVTSCCTTPRGKRRQCSRLGFNGGPCSPVPAAGTYSSGGTTAPCTACGPGQTSQQGAISADWCQCPAGQGLLEDTTQCTTCPPGSYMAKHSASMTVRISTHSKLCDDVHSGYSHGWPVGPTMTAVHTPSCLTGGLL